MTVIERIFSIMREKKLSAYALSKETGIANSTISDWKKGKGKPSAEAISAIAQYLSVSSDYLLGLTDDPAGIKNIAVMREDGHFGPVTDDERKAIMAFLEVYRAKK